MRTDDLIATLARDAAGPTETLTPAAARLRGLGAAGLGLLASGGLAALVFGARPDLAAAAWTAPVLLKVFGSAAFALGGLWLALRAAEPGRRLRPGAAVAPLALVALAVALFWPQTPLTAWAPTADIVSLKCVLSVPLLALAPLGGLMAVLRGAAPTDPGLAGAAAGLAAGGLGAMGYSVHCPVDIPGYVAFWYPGGMAVAALIGFGIGRRALVW